MRGSARCAALRTPARNCHWELHRETRGGVTGCSLLLKSCERNRLAAAGSHAPATHSAAAGAPRRGISSGAVSPRKSPGPQAQQQRPQGGPASRRGHRSRRSRGSMYCEAVCARKSSPENCGNAISERVVLFSPEVEPTVLAMMSQNAASTAPLQCYHRKTAGLSAQQRHSPFRPKCRLANSRAADLRNYSTPV